MTLSDIKAIVHFYNSLLADRNINYSLEFDWEITGHEQFEVRVKYTLKARDLDTRITYPIIEFETLAGFYDIDDYSNLNDYEFVYMIIKHMYENFPFSIENIKNLNKTEKNETV